MSNDGRDVPQSMTKCIKPMLREVLFISAGNHYVEKISCSSDLNYWCCISLQMYISIGANDFTEQHEFIFILSKLFVLFKQTFLNLH